MAIKLENKTNVVAPNATYPYGNIKDNSGANDGTPVNTEVYGDIHQFFARLLALSSIVANGLPDNATNGFQYYQALQSLIQSYIDALGEVKSVKVSSNDTTSGYLNGKLIAGSNITLTEGNDGGNETLTISLSNNASSYNTTLTSSGSGESAPITVQYFKLDKIVFIFFNFTISAGTFSANADFYRFPLPFNQIGTPNYSIGQLIHSSVPNGENLLVRADSGYLNFEMAEANSGTQIDEPALEQTFKGQIFYLTS